MRSRAVNMPLSSARNAQDHRLGSNKGNDDEAEVVERDPA
jgi:hypothetical protein